MRYIKERPGCGTAILNLGLAPFIENGVFGMAIKPCTRTGGAVRRPTECSNRCKGWFMKAFGGSLNERPGLVRGDAISFDIAALEIRLGLKVTMKFLREA
jgi:hypothetical protein